MHFPTTTAVLLGITAFATAQSTVSVTIIAAPSIQSVSSFSLQTVSSFSSQSVSSTTQSVVTVFVTQTPFPPLPTAITSTPLSLLADLATQPPPDIQTPTPIATLITITRTVIPQATVIPQVAVAIGNIQPPPITNSGNPERPFEVNGNTFTNLAGAFERACAVQKNGCADGVNSGAVGGAVADCEAQQDACLGN